MVDAPRARAGHAFGLALESDFDVLGLVPDAATERLPECSLRLVEGAALTAEWAGAGARSVLVEGAPEAPAATIDVHDELGYRLSARYFGTCVVRPGAARIDCAPPPVPAWRWQRFLVGRVLPFAAMHRGYEILHASAVALDGRVLAFAGARGWGKTSLAVNLVLGAGARLVTDDVLVLEVRDGRPFVHPGLGVTNLRPQEEQRLGAATAQLGDRLGRTGQTKSHYTVARESRALPLARLHLLGGGDEDAAVIRPARVTPVQLLGNAFLVGAREPASLAHLLATCGTVAETVEIVEVARGLVEGPAELATRLAA
ncbi:hypothetical protein DVA67_018545 [Solirubrobacter sp. CPCC 204708]|uniref:Serine kinase n=1 Tax=Solirubrobacter deserti TaxID=2282478 RepID=A0ABT4RMA1_9ACTN|nr:hypothetical protein [Solirubrobacter deserti]MBE2317987.1 hypothetical protein [Solirubrobacter deserti]MDA0139666.1 hypothetical protein [Solirubrobacter deserti]